MTRQNPRLGTADHGILQSSTESSVCLVWCIAVFVGMTLVAMTGCDTQVLLEKFAPVEDQAFAKVQITKLRSRDFAAIESVADPSIKSPGLEKTLAEMADKIPAGEPESVKLVGVHRTAGTSTSTNLTYQYGYANKWLLVNVVMLKSPRKTTIVGFRVQPLDRSLEEQNRFTLSGKSLLQYMVLALAIAVPLFCVYALVQCLRTPMRRRKWLWLLFILVGVGMFRVDWTTGGWFISPLYFQLLGASIYSSPFGPWTISVSVPLGAILFLIKRESLRASPPADIELIEVVSGAETKA